MLSDSDPASDSLIETLMLPLNDEDFDSLPDNDCESLSLSVNARDSLIEPLVDIVTDPLRDCDADWL
jgi:hypothetical protein